MRLENLVMQARDPIVTGRFWEAALGLQRDHADPDDYEGRLNQPGPLFDWLLNGDVPLDESGVLRVSQACRRGPTRWTS